MKFKMSLLGLFLVLATTANAQDLNDSDEKLTAEKIIEHFTHNDCPAGQICRGLPKITTENVAHPHHKKHEEAALSLNIKFGYKSIDLTEASKKQIASVGEALASDKLKDFIFKVEGHTDAVGSDAYNRQLSKERAEAVKEYLVENYQIDESRIKAVGKGKRDLLLPNEPESEINRRVRIVGLK